MTVRQPGGLDRLVRGLPRVAAVVGGLLAVTFVWTRLVSREGLELVLPVRAALILILLACLLLWALIAPERSATSRFFRSRTMVFLGTYSYGLYVYHHFISYYLTTNRTELELAHWLGSHGAAVALQATVGASASLALAYLSYELFEKRFLRLKRLFETAKEPAPQRPAAVGAAEVRARHCGSRARGTSSRACGDSGLSDADFEELEPAGVARPPQRQLSSMARGGEPGPARYAQRRHAERV